MFLSIATTHRPATDLGYLLHKHPERMHETELGFGKSVVFYPQATAERCEAALVLDVDPVGLVRGKGSAEGLLDQYVNDRPYVASSFLSVALTRTLRTAMGGTSKERPELALTAISLEVVLTPLPARGGERLVRSLFEPLGWSVDVEPIEGVGSQSGHGSRYVTLHLAGTERLSVLLNQLYVLIPVLDDDKHYWVGEDEITKLLSHGEGWLENHPAKELIVQRYLKHRFVLANMALARLAPETEDEAEESAPERRDAPEEALERPIRLNDERMDTVVEALRASGAKSVADLGCGEGKLLARLVRERWAERLIGVDASACQLERASKKLKLHESGGPPEGRVTLLHGALTYRDKRIAGVDAAVLVEVIEHLDADRLPSLQRALFGAARPATVVVTTPNAEYNALFPNLAKGAFRHPDHRFEWTREQFREWVRAVETEYGYSVELRDIGTVNETFGAPTQIAVFTR
ncbi:MAG TPA: 3' terminal RNA ribose 2'-O-methyltransferase Hen1 [Rhizomicrobium sp.]|jgi:3' terminal RNA ribose 2'-O-methyltransferase Hen1|nr:3' terminal RNA ribose 2'-O-methyltransferase Hen1 [Rhizomicrobium sp.]